MPSNDVIYIASISAIDSMNNWVLGAFDHSRASYIQGADQFP